MLIFEWGTTWPFWMPEGVPVDQIPFKDDIGKVVRVSHLQIVFLCDLGMDTDESVCVVESDPCPADDLLELPEGPGGRPEEADFTTERERAYRRQGGVKT